MKKVNATYFKDNGKFYTKEVIEIEEDTDGHHAMTKVLPRLHRLSNMTMLVQDGGDDKEPYIIPHMYKPKE